MKKYNVAVVGATGNVGREILNIVDERKFPVKKLFFKSGKIKLFLKSVSSIVDKCLCNKI